MRLILSTLVLSATLAGPRVARADDAVPPGVRLADPGKSDPRVAPPDRKLRRAIGLGLVIGAAAMAVIGFGLVGGAAQANKDVFAGHTYHPGKEDLRDSLERGDAVLFSAAAVTLIPGVVLLCDH